MSVAVSAGMWFLVGVIFRAQSPELSPSFWAGPAAFPWLLTVLGVLGYRGSRDSDRGHRPEYWHREAQVAAVYGVLATVVGFVEVVTLERSDTARNMGYMPFTALFMGLLFLSLALLMTRSRNVERALNARPGG
jgi:hypothetical protein